MARNDVGIILQTTMLKLKLQCFSDFGALFIIFCS